MKFYDQLTKTAVFTSVRELLHGINSMSTRKVDEHSGHLTLRGLRITDEEGVTLAYTNPIEIFKGLKEDFGLPVDIAGCIRRGRVFRIKMTEHPTITECGMQVKAVVLEPEKEVVEMVESEIKEPLIQLNEDVTEEVVSEETVTGITSGIDWEYVDSLKNTKYGKQDLEAYARDKHQVELDCRRSLSNMKKDLKEAVESK